MEYRFCIIILHSGRLYRFKRVSLFPRGIQITTLSDHNYPPGLPLQSKPLALSSEFAPEIWQENCQNMHEYIMISRATVGLSITFYRRRFNPITVH